MLAGVLDRQNSIALSLPHPDVIPETENVAKLILCPFRSLGWFLSSSDVIPETENVAKLVLCPFRSLGWFFSPSDVIPETENVVKLVLCPLRSLGWFPTPSDVIPRIEVLQSWFSVHSGRQAGSRVLATLFQRRNLCQRRVPAYFCGPHVSLSWFLVHASHFTDSQRIYAILLADSTILAVLIGWHYGPGTGLFRGPHVSLSWFLVRKSLGRFKADLYDIYRFR